MSPSAASTAPAIGGVARNSASNSSGTATRHAAPARSAADVAWPDGRYYMPLFVVPADGERFDDTLRAELVSAIRQHLSPRHVPDTIVPIAAVPRTLTGKKLEVPVKRILQGARITDVAAEGSVTRPDMLNWFANFSAELGHL
ncbi:AMP-binding enzyme [Streptomyces sp. cg35]|uniref:AMP-binding enzyme n=1 Tax=Streptomyces sp. cg35 TaxID=3421650 RepID=UPI003D187002